MFGSNYFPGISIYNVLGNNQPSGISSVYLNFGPNAESQSANTGVFQNRLAPRADGIWMLGKHTLSFGGTYTYTQLNTIDKRTGTGTIATDDFSQMLQGFVTPGDSSTGFYVTSFLQGNANRYYRANQLGTYVQDKWQITPTLSLTAGVRYDWDAASLKNTDVSSTSIPAFITTTSAPTPSPTPASSSLKQCQRDKGCEQHQLTGRQWGIGPRVGAAWSPARDHNTVVISHRRWHVLRPRRAVHLLLARLRHRHRAGGPFGVNQQLPFRQYFHLPHWLAVPLRVLHPHLRRKRRLQSTHWSAHRRNRQS